MILIFASAFSIISIFAFLTISILVVSTFASGESRIAANSFVLIPASG
jgi:hypothetical protein